MKIKSFGCSFIFGSDLSDLPEAKILVNPVGTFSKLTWPAILADRLGYEYECHARPGSGNLQIAERVLNECNKNDSALYIIDWTWIDRFDFIKSKDWWQPWGTIAPQGQDQMSNLYYKNLHSEYSDKFRTLIYIKAVIVSLIENNIKFLMTYEDDLMFDQTWHASSANKELQNAVSTYMTTFEGQGFLSWSRKKAFSESAKWHPLEQAHQAAADYMLDFLINKIQAP